MIKISEAEKADGPLEDIRLAFMRASTIVEITLIYAAEFVSNSCQVIFKSFLKMLRNAPNINCDVSPTNHTVLSQLAGFAFWLLYCTFILATNCFKRLKKLKNTVAFQAGKLFYNSNVKIRD